MPIIKNYTHEITIYEIGPGIFFFIIATIVNLDNFIIVFELENISTII